MGYHPAFAEGAVLPGYSKTPVILLVFANDRAGDTSSYLRNLMAEKRAIVAALEPAVTARHCQVVIEHSLTHKRFYDLLDTYGARVVGVHFAGHADPSGLQFEDHYGDSVAARMQGIAERLARLDTLRWVFLNGCGTAVHVDALHRRVPVPVIATEHAIRDDVAAKFASRFYFSFARGQCIGDAFGAAEDEVKTHTGRPADVARAERPLFFDDGPPPADPPVDDAADAADTAPHRMLRPGGIAPTEWPWILALPTTSVRPKPPQDWRLVPLKPAAPPPPTSGKIDQPRPKIEPPGTRTPRDFGPALTPTPPPAPPPEPPWHRRPAARVALALALLVIVALVLSPKFEGCEPDPVVPDAAPGPAPDAAAGGDARRDASADGDDDTPADAQPTEPDAAPAEPDAAPAEPDAAPAPDTQTRAAPSGPSPAELRAERLRRTRNTLLSKATRQANACDCGGLRSTVSRLAAYGVDRAQLHRDHCATASAGLGKCGKAIDARITRALARCPCDDAATKADVDRLKREFGKDRAREYNLRCVVPGLPQSCNQ